MRPIDTLDLLRKYSNGINKHMRVPMLDIHLNVRVDVSGTDAKVTLTLLGEGQAAQWAPVLDQNTKHFQKGKTDTFIVGRDQDFGEVSALT